jgi:cytochrome c-type biogenesis protein CcmF
MLGEFWKGARTRMKTAGENFAQALYNLTMQNTRRYGGYIVHLGIVLLFIGFAGLAFKTHAKGLMQEGDLLRVKNYLLRCDGLTSGDTPNYEYTRALITVTKNGHAFASVHPEKRFYKASQQPTSYVSIHPTLAEDLYVVLSGLDQDTGKAVIEVFVNPLVMWVWIGGVVVFLGTLLALVPSRVEREMAEIRRTQEMAVQANDAI